MKRHKNITEAYHHQTCDTRSLMINCNSTWIDNMCHEFEFQSKSAFKSWSTWLCTFPFQTSFAVSVLFLFWLWLFLIRRDHHRLQANGFACDCERFASWAIFAPTDEIRDTDRDRDCEFHLTTPNFRHLTAATHQMISQWWAANWLCLTFLLFSSLVSLKSNVIDTLCCRTQRLFFLHASNGSVNCVSPAAQKIIQTILSPTFFCVAVFLASRIIRIFKINIK